MPTLLLTLFLLQVFIQVINTIGASTIDESVCLQYYYFLTSPALPFEEELESLSKHCEIIIKKGHIPLITIIKWRLLFLLFPLSPSVCV